MTTITRTISKEIVVKTVTRVTNIDVQKVIILPKSVFTVHITAGDCPTYKRFLNVNIRRAWVAKDELVKQLIWGINKYLGEDFVQLCRGGDRYNFSLHYNLDSNKEIRIKRAGEDYIVFTRKTTTEDKVEYKELF